MARYSGLEVLVVHLIALRRQAALLVELEERTTASVRVAYALPVLAAVTSMSDLWITGSQVTTYRGAMDRSCTATFTTNPA